MTEMKTTPDRNDASSARQRREIIGTRTEQAIADLLNQLAQPGSSLLPTLTLMSRFRRYSLSNQLLILAQCPHATDVRGYRAWQRAGRQVRKGEHGIAIWAPIARRPDAASNAIATRPTLLVPGDTHPTNATPVETDADSRPRFRIAYLWDISSCEPVPTKASPATVPSILATSALPDTTAAHLATLTAVIAPRFPIAVLPLRSSLYGYTDGQSITLNAHHDIATRCATLVHEYTHACLHFAAERPDLTTRETEAEGVAFIVCQALGIPVPTSIDYIRAYRGTPTTLRDSLIRIRELANALLQALLPRDGAVSAEPD